MTEFVNKPTYIAFLNLHETIILIKIINNSKKPKSWNTICSLCSLSSRNPLTTFNILIMNS